MTLIQALEFLGTAALTMAGVALVGGAISYDRFKPVAITLGPSTTIYFRDPTLDTRVHEAIHRRQMRDKSSLGQLASALRYTTDSSPTGAEPRSGSGGPLTRLGPGLLPRGSCERARE